MPRSRGGASRPSAPARPTAPAPQRSMAPQQQTRQMSTAPAQQRQAPPQQAAPAAQGPGLFGQMASTAAGVAVGSSIGHAIGGFFGGGSSSSVSPEQQQTAEQAMDNYSTPSNQAMDSGLYQANAQANAGPCAVDVKNFKTCMDQNGSDLNICGWYLEQLRACQGAARSYTS